jgi:branched-chain amino acid transport system permease protein/neutral amino acid transport system permease protein
MTTLMTVVLFGLYSAALYAIGGVGFTLQFGVTNVLNLAYGSLITSSIFAEYYLTGHSTNLWVAMTVGGAAGAVLSFVVGFVIIGAFVRRGARGFNVAMVAIALSLILQYSLEAIQGPVIDAFASSNRSTVLSVAGVNLDSQQVTAIVVAIVLMVGVHLLLRMTKLGLAMRATADDVALTRVSGVSPARTRALAWLVSGALCGICGVLLGIGIGTFDASTGNDFFITAAAAAIAGGVGKPYGAMLGALIVGVITQASAAIISPAFSSISAWVLLIAFLLVRPQGIFATYAAERELVA